MSKKETREVLVICLGSILLFSGVVGFSHIIYLNAVRGIGVGGEFWVALTLTFLLLLWLFLAILGFGIIISQIERKPQTTLNTTNVKNGTK